MEEEGFIYIGELSTSSTDVRLVLTGLSVRNGVQIRLLERRFILWDLLELRCSSRS